jgi:hypothetical protein
MDIPDEIGERHSDAWRAVMRTRPTTPTGLAALTTWTREEADRLRKDGSNLFHEDLCALTATIDDAARGMSGLKAWSPVAGQSGNPRPEEEIIQLGQEFERLLALEKPLRKRSRELYALTDRVQCKKVGVEPDDDAAVQKVARTRHDEWMAAWDAATKETGYNKAAREWNRASVKTAGIGKKILKLKATTPAGLLIGARVIETHDEILDREPAEQLVAEIKGFAKLLKAA